MHNILPDHVYACDWQKSSRTYINLITEATETTIIGKLLWTLNENAISELVLYDDMIDKYSPRMTLLCHKDDLIDSSVGELFPEYLI